ncbi:hypothetical protein D9M68_705180 [compost metagenome]
MRVEGKHQRKHHHREEPTGQIGPGELEPLHRRVVVDPDILRTDHQQRDQADAHADAGGHGAGQPHRHQIEQGRQAQREHLEIAKDGQQGELVDRRQTDGHQQPPVVVLAGQQRAREGGHQRAHDRHQDQTGPRPVPGRLDPEIAREGKRQEGTDGIHTGQAKVQVECIQATPSIRATGRSPLLDGLVELHQFIQLL